MLYIFRDGLDNQLGISEQEPRRRTYGPGLIAEDVVWNNAAAEVVLAGLALGRSPDTDEIFEIGSLSTGVNTYRLVEKKVEVKPEYVREHTEPNLDPKTERLCTRCGNRR